MRRPFLKATKYRVAEKIGAPIPSLEQVVAMPKSHDKSTIRAHESGAAARATPEMDSEDHGVAAALLLGRAAKRSFDIIVATTGLILFSPILLLSSLAIKISSREPVLCRHPRNGCNGKEFLVLKFASNEITGSVKSSPRMAYVSRVLRSSGIDGLPQLINVVGGDMSIVGPRPYITVLRELFCEQISQTSGWREVKSGITGWAQVNGYWDESNSFKVMRRQIDYDLYYVEHWSFFFDARIVLMTLVSKNAYAITE
jgi:lipopolysaccharide/colanic/teichoic acid biosynthesis glycosyltransferase